MYYMFVIPKSKYKIKTKYLRKKHINWTKQNKYIYKLVHAAVQQRKCDPWNNHYKYKWTNFRNLRPKKTSQDLPWLMTQIYVKISKHKNPECPEMQHKTRLKIMCVSEKTLYMAGNGMHWIKRNIKWLTN